MRRLLPLAALLLSPAAPASDLAQPITAMAYWQKPLDATDKRASFSSFGLRLDQRAVTSNVFARPPIMDMRFNDRGFHSLAWRGIVLHQNQPAGGEPAGEINWMLILSGTAAAAVIIHEENKKSPTQPVPRKGGGN